MKRCLVLILLLAAVLPLRGQDYDAALDRFASITNECQRLKARIEEGENLQEGTLDRVIAELRLLQKELQGGSKTMSSAQKERYRLILKCYREGKMVPASALHADSIQAGQRASPSGAPPGRTSPRSWLPWLRDGNGFVAAGRRFGSRLPASRRKMGWRFSSRFRKRLLSFAFADRHQ